MKGELTSEIEECLRNQVVNAESPGTILHDFQVVLDYLGEKGMVSGGKYNLLPMKAIPELDPLLSRPLKLALKRPQLRSHPYLQGLNLLLRASRLVGVEGAGDKARLVVDPFMKAQWERLNPTEQYFTLLEAFLLRATPEMIGLDARMFDDGFVFMSMITWKALSDPNPRFGSRDSWLRISCNLRDHEYVIALMDLFGLLRVDQRAGGKPPWPPIAVHRTTFGDAILTLLFLRLGKVMGMPKLDLPTVSLTNHDDDPGDDEFEPRYVLGKDPIPDQASEVEDQPTSADLAEDVADESDEPDGLGALYPVLTPYFPELAASLEFPDEQPRDGVYVFHVSLGKEIWRRIAMPHDSSMEQLAFWILKSIQFDDDHLYDFELRDRQGCLLMLGTRDGDDSLPAYEFDIGFLPLDPGQTMVLRYDYGADWRFEIKLERIEPVTAKIKAPAILEKHGKSPSQYGLDDFD